MRIPIAVLLAALLTSFAANAQVQIPPRDENYWKAQQDVEFTRGNAVAAQERLRDAERALQDAKSSREKAEKDVELARQREAEAQRSLPALQERHQAALRAWQDAKTKFEGLRK